ncbi:MAG: acetyl-CoA carboxylase, biotin carboxyl carrier protein [Campylobacteraceae bacterium 4484_4]|nr:MAG: acetyl-CoA carboxylase, biotin carboxyl carrier protein [Campylobacteraceae bacterium 4484_4]
MKQNEITELIKLFDESNISKLKINDNEFSITLEKATATPPAVAPVPAAAPTPVAAPAPAPATEEATAPQKTEGETINSPMVGTFYRAPSPGAAPFVKVGDTVSKGETVAIVEAMKIMNEIEAEYDCKILEILVEDGQPVEYDMPLFRVERV